MPKSILNFIVIISIVQLWLSFGFGKTFYLDSNGQPSYPKAPSLPPMPLLTPPPLNIGGFLLFSNTDSRDAYIKVVDPHSRRLVTAFYVKSNSNYIKTQIPSGTYEVQVFFGEDWDSKTQSFTRNRSFANQGSFKFTKNKGYKIPPEKVDGGNATISGADK